MTGDRLSAIHRGLIAVLVTVYVVAGIAGLFADFDRTSDTAIWVVFLCGGAALILIGVVASRSSARLSAVLVSIGAVAGGITLLWTILVPIAVAVLIAVSFSLARRPSRA